MSARRVLQAEGEKLVEGVQTTSLLQWLLCGTDANPKKKGTPNKKKNNVVLEKKREESVVSRSYTNGKRTGGAHPRPRC